MPMEEELVEIAEPPPAMQPPPVAQDTPVSKEERFSDDIDRSWPRSQSVLTQRTSIDVEPTSTPGTTSSPRSSVPPLSPEKHVRALFNERSNKLEPLNKPYQPGPSRGGANGVRPEERDSKRRPC